MNMVHPQLPEFDPSPDLWARIKSDLNNEQLLSRVIDELPHHQPASDLWLAIEQELDQSSWCPKQPFTFYVSRPFLGTALVAAVIILVSFGLFLRPASTEEVRIEYAVETPTHHSTGRSLSQAFTNKSAEAFIAHQCVEQKLACQRPEVHELRNQLVDLANEWERIERERQVFGDNPMLIKAQTKVENQRIEITKELITILRS